MSKIYKILVDKILVEKICKIITIFGREMPCEREAGESRTFLVQKLTTIETKRNLNWVVLFDRWDLQERERNAAFIKRRSSRVRSDVRSVDSLHSFITVLCTRPLQNTGEGRGERRGALATVLSEKVLRVIKLRLSAWKVSCHYGF